MRVKFRAVFGGGEYEISEDALNIIRMSFDNYKFYKYRGKLCIKNKRYEMGLHYEDEYWDIKFEDEELLRVLISEHSKFVYGDK